MKKTTMLLLLLLWSMVVNYGCSDGTTEPPDGDNDSDGDMEQSEGEDGDQSDGDDDFDVDSTDGDQTEVDGDVDSDTESTDSDELDQDIESDVVYPTPLPWYTLEVKPYDPDNPDPNCEEDEYYPGNSTPENALLIESGDRFVNMALCEYGSKDYYRMELEDDDILAIVKNQGYLINGLVTEKIHNIEKAHHKSESDFFNWDRKIILKSNPSNYITAIRDISDDDQYYSFGIDTYKHISLSQNPKLPAPLSSDHYLITSVLELIDEENISSCFQQYMSEYKNTLKSNRVPVYGTIKLNYENEQPHVIAVVGRFGVMSLLHDCNDPTSVIDCVKSGSDPYVSTVININDYDTQAMCISFGSYVEMNEMNQIAINSIKILFAVTKD